MTVYANGREVSGKAQPNKVISGFPSVCLSPPSPPAGPIPIPYPMFTDASKTSDGTGSVLIKGKEVGKKNGSTYASSKGNEPATRSFGMDVVSHTLSNASRHEAYSFDVMFEKSGAERFMDLTTTNHSNPASAVGLDTAKMAIGAAADRAKCKALSQANKDVRDDVRSRRSTPEGKEAADKPTITHGVFTPPGSGAPHVVRACSNKRVGAYYAGMAEGTPPNSGPGASQSKPSGACGGHTYREARSSCRPHTSHTESRIIEDLFKEGAPDPSGGSLLMSINWESAGSQDACEHCQELLCSVNKSSNPASGCIEIKICHGQPGEPKSLADLGYC
jgi:hypothetical protein